MQHFVIRTALLGLVVACTSAVEEPEPVVPPPATGPYVATTVQTVTDALPGADGIAQLGDGRMVVSAPTVDELWTVDLTTGETARFTDAVDEPYGLATHPSGDVLVANWAAQNILRITPAGAVSVFADTTDRFGNVYVDEVTGDVYLPSFATGQLERITPAGVRETVAEGVANRGLHAVMLDDDRVLYTGYVNSGEIYKHDAAGVGALFATLPGRLGNLKWFDGRLFASSFDTNRVFTVDPDGTVTRWLGRWDAGHVDGTAEEARFESPNGFWIEGTTMFVTESEGRIRRVEMERGA